MTLVRVAAFALLVACSAPASTPVMASASPTPTDIAAAPASTPTPTADRTKPPALVVQPQLQLPTRVRWAIDQGSPDDTLHRSLLVLFYDGQATWRIVDASGTLLFRVPIAGSGIFGPETCVSKARQQAEVTTWIALDVATLDAFMQRYRTYKAIAEGIPSGEASLELVDSGCRPS
jgi:hypothetical protein